MFSLLRAAQKDEKKRSQMLYQSVVDQARRPVFYDFYGVPDSIDGRFELICIHAFLIMDRLEQAGLPGRRTAQALFDVMFRDMEWSLREQGVGDLSIPKHVKRMMKGFNGRAHAYRDAAGDRQAMKRVLARNVYATGAPPDDSVLAGLTDYIVRARACLAATPLDELPDSTRLFPGIRKKEDDYGEEKRAAAG